MITGFRWDIGGAQAAYGIAPDLSTFGKAIANGFSLSALVGRREIMELGGLHTDRDRVFLLSTTHGGETTALAAGLATLATYEDEDVIGHLRWAGETLRAGITAAARQLGVEEHFEVLGHPANLVYATRTRMAAVAGVPHAVPPGDDSARRAHAVARRRATRTTRRRSARRSRRSAGRSRSTDAPSRTASKHHLVGRPVQPVFRRQSW